MTRRTGSSSVGAPARPARGRASAATTRAATPTGSSSSRSKTGFIDSADEPKTADSPFADYSTKGVDDERLGGGIAGVAGVLMVLVLMGGIAFAVRRRRTRRGRRALVGAGHGHRLHYHGHSAIHRAPAHLKLLALVGFVLVVVATPRDWYAVYAVYLARRRRA